MTTRQKKAPAQTKLKETVLEGTQKLEKAAVESKKQAVELG